MCVNFLLLILWECLSFIYLLGVTTRCGVHLKFILKCYFLDLLISNLFYFILPAFKCIEVEMKIVGEKVRKRIVARFLVFIGLTTFLVCFIDSLNSFPFSSNLHLFLHSEDWSDFIFINRKLCYTMLKQLFIFLTKDKIRFPYITLRDRFLRYLHSADLSRML